MLSSLHRFEVKAKREHENSATEVMKGLKQINAEEKTAVDQLKLALFKNLM